MKFLLGVIYMLVTGAVLLSMAALFLRGTKEKSNRSYLMCQGMVALWCASQVLLLLAHTKGELVIAYLIGNVGICFVGTFWFYFAVEYTGGRLVGIKRYVPILLSAFHYLLVVTNGWHHLYYTSFDTEVVVHGVFFYTNVIITYVFVIWGAIILYHSMQETEQKEIAEQERGQQNRNGRRLVVAAVLVPVILNAVYLTGVVKSTFDITPLGFAISVILVLLATVKYQFIDLRRELAITNEKLLLERERNRIAQEVHDTAGHTLTMIQSYLKLAEVSVKEEKREQTEEYLSQARTLISTGIRELRESINRLRQEAEYELVTQGVMQLANQVKEIPVEVTVQGTDSERYSHLSKIIYDTVRESITNTLKYAQASKLEIVLRFKEREVELVIGDDGKGCKELLANHGIRGIRERIESAGGTVRFFTAEGEGFLMRSKLPV